MESKASNFLVRAAYSSGTVIIELTVNHGPEGASVMDPFGVRPIAFPYVLSDWFGDELNFHTLC